MPSNYAHYRFGAQALALLPPEVASVARQNRKLYDMGLHGPDLFYYYNPLHHTRVGALGSSYHQMTGQVFFSRAMRRLRLSPDPQAEAYLWGVLGHYCLDSRCHPLVNGWDAQGNAHHVEIETEFDRFLLEKDGKVPPYAQDNSAHMRINREQCGVIAAFYPPATAGNIYRCAGNMVFFTRLLARPEGRGRGLVEKGGGLVGEMNAQMIMPKTPNPRCADYDAILLEHYQSALAEFPDMAGLLCSGGSPDQRFAATFDG